ncbi:hypothetical protein [Chitinivorax sp. B]|uniref:hypothetical protein n=1 Tax=Chitinivorax sp. B TaxID=2502235 RepID=UPI0010FA3927|nr:hypothetical protein [Chitinivorax sp. B]
MKRKVAYQLALPPTGFCPIEPNDRLKRYLAVALAGLQAAIWNEIKRKAGLLPAPSYRHDRWCGSTLAGV